MTLREKNILNSIMRSKGLKNFLATYNVAATIALAVATIIVIIMLVFNTTKLAKAGDNPQERRTAINGIAICLICFAFLGGIDVLYAFLVTFILG